MPGLVIPEIEALRDRDPMIFEALSALTSLIAKIPLVRGKGSPEGQYSSPPGVLYVAMDPKMGDVLYVKLSGQGNTGWVNIPTAYSGGVVSKFTEGGTTASAVYVTVGTPWQTVVPPNCNQMTFTLVFTGAGKARIKMTLPDRVIYSNELTASGTFTLNGLQGGTFQTEIEALATAGNVTATVEILQQTTMMGSQVSGGRATGGTGQAVPIAVNPAGSIRGDGPGDFGRPMRFT